MRRGAHSTHMLRVCLHTMCRGKHSGFIAAGIKLVDGKCCPLVTYLLITYSKSTGDRSIIQTEIYLLLNLTSENMNHLFIKELNIKLLAYKDRFCKK